MSAIALMHYPLISIRPLVIFHLCRINTVQFSEGFFLSSFAMVGNQLWHTQWVHCYFFFEKGKHCIYSAIESSKWTAANMQKQCGLCCEHHQQQPANIIIFNYFNNKLIKLGLRHGWWCGGWFWGWKATVSAMSGTDGKNCGGFWLDETKATWECFPAACQSFNQSMVFFFFF